MYFDVMKEQGEECIGVIMHRTPFGKLSIYQPRQESRTEVKFTLTRFPDVAKELPTVTPQHITQYKKLDVDTVQFFIKKVTVIPKGYVLI